jgi:hypothetical protein
VSGQDPHGKAARPVASALDVASRIIETADRDVAFVLRLVGESQYILIRHFHNFIEAELAHHGVVYGDHPLLRPFIETHARELAEFVHNGIGLRHRFDLRAFEAMRGDPSQLLRVDLWDSLRSHIEHAERHFVSGPHGLRAILDEVEADRTMRKTETRHDG